MPDREQPGKPPLRASVGSGVAPPPEFDLFLMRIGQINYAWTNTESLLIHLLAGLVPTDTATATILHLSLNTSRARIDLVERLSKRQGCPLPPPARARILDVSRRLKGLSGLRNRMNHCIYAFDADGGPVRSIQMRIADRKHSLRIGDETVLDSANLAELDGALTDMQAINAEVWSIVSEHGLPV